MPYADSDGVRLYYEEVGKGTPIVFVHEFSGDLRSWEAQIQHFSRRYRCIAYNARGYAPSDVPTTPSKYSPSLAVEDLAAVMRAASVKKAHIMGCSMGSLATLHFGLTYPRMAISLTAIGAIGGVNDPKARARALRETEAQAQRFESEGAAGVLKRLKLAPNRVQLAQKNPRGFDDFCRRFLEHSAPAKAAMLRGLQARRRAIYTYERELRALKVPTHIVCGDEDDGALDAALFIKRTCAAARLTVAPASGHVVNMEEPHLLNRLTEEFYALVESGRWRPRKL
ncbi:MAG: alpha/beta fold hydrolase [Rhodospirillaceae bacterium]